MHSQSENTQAVLPYHVVRSNLNPREKALWAELSLRFGQAQEIFADTKSLAAELHCGVGTVRRAIAGMLEKGFLRFLPKKIDKRHRAYFMAWNAADVHPLAITKAVKESRQQELEAAIAQAKALEISDEDWAKSPEHHS